MHRRTVHAALSIVVVAALTASAVTTPAYARPDDRPAAATTTTASGSVHSLIDELAHQIAGVDQATAARLGSAAAKAPVDLAAAGLDARLAAAVRVANGRVLAAKGLPANAGSLLRLRLAHPDMRAELARGVAPLIAATPTDDDTQQIIAYDRAGATVLLDADRVPDRPVLLVEVDTAKALPLGLSVMRQTLTNRGVGADRTTMTSVDPSAQADYAVTGGYWATKVTAVRLQDDKEPWVKGAAEIFNVVAGFGLDGKVKVDLVQMPYLDYDGTTYYPNQLLVHFNGYKYNLADVVMMEDDGDTNYLALAQALATALLTIVDGGLYVPLVNAILAAMPSSWWTDDPDYVDSWYTLATTSSGRLTGAAGNGWLDVVPYFVSEL